MDEEDFQLILKYYNSKFITYGIALAIYSIEDISELVYTISEHERNLQGEYDDISLKTKLILTRFSGNFEMLSFDQTSFFNFLLGFIPFWDYKPTNAIHADSSGENKSDKFFNSSTIDKILSKCDDIDGSVRNGTREPKLFRFILDKPSGCKVLCKPETKHYRKGILVLF